MAKKRPHSRPHNLTTDLVNSAVAAQTPIIPQRTEQVETGRTRELQMRERVGQRTDRELHSATFPPEK